MPPLPYPTPTSPAVSAVMRGNRKEGNRPETRIRSALHARGYRFRKNLALVVGDVRVKPDIVFTRARVAVFVDGCFWHRCPTHGTDPRANRFYWAAKLERNVARDERVNEALRLHAWRVVRIWEHDDVERAVEMIAAELEHQGASTRGK